MANNVKESLDREVSLRNEFDGGVEELVGFMRDFSEATGLDLKVKHRKWDFFADGNESYTITLKNPEKFAFNTIYSGKIYADKDKFNLLEKNKHASYNHNGGELIDNENVYVTGFLFQEEGTTTHRISRSSSFSVVRERFMRSVCKRAVNCLPEEQVSRANEFLQKVPA